VVFADLTVLGSGTIVPMADRGCAGYLLRGDRGRAVLLDCGPGTLGRLAQIGVSAAEIRTLFLTHFHLDHVADLAPLLNARWMLSAAGPREMEIVGPNGTRGHLAWLASRMDPWFADYRFAVHEARDGLLEVAGIRVASVATGHTAESICFRLEDERGRSVFYSGDTPATDAIVPLARGADLAVIECSMPDEARSDGHLSPSLAGRIARLAGVRKLVLTHFYPEAAAVDVLAKVREVFSGPAVLAEDRMCFTFDR